MNKNILKIFFVTSRVKQYILKIKGVYNVIN